MTRKTKQGKNLAAKDLAGVAADFEHHDFTPDELKKIKKTRRRSPRLGEANAEVYSFRAPPSYKDRIRRRADSDKKSESQIIRDALDAYL